MITHYIGLVASLAVQAWKILEDTEFQLISNGWICMGKDSCPSVPYRLDFLLSKQNEWSVKRPSGKMWGDPGEEKAEGEDAM